MMKRLVGILMVAGAMTALAETTTPGGLVFTLKKSATEDVLEKQDGEVRSYSGMVLHHGSPALRYRLENPTATPRTARITVKGRYYGYGRNNDLIYLTSVPVGAGEKQDGELRLPFVNLGYGQYRTVELDDGVGKKTCGETVECGMHVGSNGWHDPDEPPAEVLGEHFDPLVVVSKGVDEFRVRELYATAYRKYQQEDKQHKAATHGSLVDMTIRTCDFSRFTDWRDFSVASAVVINSTTWTNLSAVTRTALKGYVVAGGSLVWADKDFPPEAPSVGKHGLGEVGLLDDSLAMLVAKGARNLQFVYKNEPGRKEAKPCFPCGEALAAAVDQELGRTPFGTFILILLAFFVLAGPVTVLVLAKLNRRIHLLWIFPTVAVIFSAIVVAALVAREGRSPRIQTFTHSVTDAEFQLTAKVEDTLIVAPIPLSHAIDLPADALVSFDGGDEGVHGTAIYIDEQGFHFLDGWTPSLWPVRFRAVRVEGGAQ